MKTVFFSFLLGVTIICGTSRAQTQQPNKQPAYPPQPQGQLGWYQQPFTFNDAIANPSYPNRDTAYLGGGKTVYRTTNGGAAWLPWGPSGRYDYTHFVEGYYGWVGKASNNGLDRDTLWFTSDGGLHWLEEDPLGRLNTNLRFFHNHDTGFACVEAGISKTTDAGKTWRFQVCGGVMRGIGRFNEHDLIAVGWGGDTAAIVLSGDNGETWTRSPYARLLTIFNDVACIDDSTAITTGFWRTRDRGISWKQLGEGGSNSAASPAHEIATLVGNSGSIMRTTDGGTTWIDQRWNTAQDLFRVEFADSLNGMICDGDHLILHTTNGGYSWVQISPPFTKGELKVSVSPNPSQGAFRFSFHLDAPQTGTLSIVDATGRTVAEPLKDTRLANGERTININLSSLLPGDYLYSFETERYHTIGKITIVR